MNQDNEAAAFKAATDRQLPTRRKDVSNERGTPFWKDKDLWWVVLAMAAAVLFLWRMAVVQEEGIYRDGHHYIAPIIGQWMHDPDCKHDSHYENKRP